MAIMWSALWFWLVTDSPFDHSTITDKELNYLKTELAEDHTEKQVISMAGFLFGGLFLLLVGYAPNKDIAVLELTLAIGFIGLSRSGFMVNHLDIAPRYAGLLYGFLFGGLFLLLVGYAPNKDIAVLELTLAIGFIGLSRSGFMVNHLDIAPRYAGLLYGITNCLGTIPGILSPPIVGIITKNERFSMIGFLSAGLFLLLVGYAPNKDIAVLELTLAVGFSGLSRNGFLVNHLDIAPRYASLLFGITNCLATIPGILSPTIVGIITKNEVILAIYLQIYFTGFVFKGLFLVLVGYTSSKNIAILELTLAVGFSGLSKNGFLVNHLDIAPRYASLLLGITNCFATIPGILSPTIVGIMTKNEASALPWASFEQKTEFLSLTGGPRKLQTRAPLFEEVKTLGVSHSFNIYLGTTSVIWSALWFWLVTDSPFDHPTITNEELKYLEAELAEDHTEEKEICFSFKALFLLLVGYAPNKDIAILELILALAFSGLSKSGFMVNHLDIAPRYASLLLGITNCFATTSGILSPTIIGIITKNEAFFMLMVGYASNKEIAILEVTLALGFSGLSRNGFMVNHLDIAPRYAGLLFGITNCFGAATGVVSPTIVGIITTNEFPSCNADVD
eukprot:gene11314-12499_t